jgi:glycosyltransferase involved in cell wall biosynthesis
MKRISVVICSFKRYDLVENCLAVLRSQTVPKEVFELILVDNTPPEKRIDLNWQEHGVDKVVFVDTPGLSRARNAGIDAASAGLIVFLDDDAEASPQWLFELLAGFASKPDALVIGGQVRAKYITAKPVWITPKLEEYLSCINWGEGLFAIGKNQWIVGANMAFRRSVFSKYGTFDLSLGRIGSASLLSNEETHLLSKLPDGSIYYSSAALVDHLIPPERLRQNWFRKRAYWQAISDTLAGKIDPLGAHYYFDQFAGTLPLVPAEHRSLRALCYACEDGESFELQVLMTYYFAVASGLGLENA